MEYPPPRLVKLLEDLGLASPARVAAMARRARRLARGLPLVESAWVDALAQARLLSPWQAAQINAGRGEELRVGPFVLLQPLDWPDYGSAYRAREIVAARDFRVVVVAARPGPSDPLVRLEALAARASELEIEGIAPLVRAGSDGARRYAASAWAEGRSAGQWMVHFGRFPPVAVLEIARQTVAALRSLERVGMCHGDLCPRALILTDAGQVFVLQPGLRGVVRPEEGAARADLRPEAYDYLAPERVAGAVPPTPASDRYALGCVWWHLLAGRAPLGGGNSLAKLQAAQEGRLGRLDELVGDVPEPLAGAIRACTAREPAERPASFAQLVSMLGPSTAAGRGCLRRCLTGQEASHLTFDPFARDARRPKPRGVWPAVAAGLLTLAASAVGLVWLGAGPLLPTGAPPAAAQVASTAPEMPVEKPKPAAGAIAAPAVGARPSAAAALALTPGARVGAPEGQRQELAVPAEGLLVAVEGVSFENVDFVCASGSPGGPRTMIRLEAAEARFEGCTFRGSGGVIGVRWGAPGDRREGLLSLPSGRVRFSNCVFEGLGAGVECGAQGVMALEMTNTLATGGGPLVRAVRCPTAEESLRIALERATLRETGPVLECRYEAMAGQPGPIVVQTDQSAFYPRPGGALLLMVGPEDPERLLESVQWTGQGSLMGVDAAVAAWQRPDGGSHVVDDARLAISGLARSPVEFAGPAEQGAEASRITHWQGPLRSADPPGADTSRLPMVAPRAPRI